MPVKRLKSFKQRLKSILDWDYVSKSQAILVYAIVIEVGVLYLHHKYLYHPFFNTDLLLAFIWFIPSLLLINVILYFIGYTLKPFAKHHEHYAFAVGVYYALSLTFLPIMVGLVNIANGVIFVGTAMLSMLLFPRYMVYSALWLSAFIYIAASFLTVYGYLDYALAFKRHVLLHPDIENIYILSSMFYAVVYTTIAIYLYDICLKNWEEKDLINTKLSCTDELTRLLNRRGLNEVVHLQMQQARIMAQDFSLIIVDVDNFKAINDVYGHAQGDEVLKHIAKVLRQNLRISAVVGRYGGEEFIILLPFTNLEHATSVAEGCRQALESQPILLRHEILELYVRASFGVSSMANEIFDFDQLFDLADQALYRAKKNGRNQVCAA